MASGHHAIQRRLKREIPPVALFVGPESVGKTTVAFHTIRAHGLPDADVARVQKLTVSAAREVAESSLVAPRGDVKVYVIHLDRASGNAMNALLKALEEAPPTSRFILISTEMPPETVASRAEIFRFALLPEANVLEILERRGINPTVAKNAARASKGQMVNALRYINGSADAKMGVLSTVNALVMRDEEALSAQASKWTDDHTHLLTTLSYELITKQWRTFDPSEVEGVSNKLALRVLEAVRPQVRGRLTINASLMAVLKGDS